MKKGPSEVQLLCSLFCTGLLVSCGIQASPHHSVAECKVCNGEGVLEKRTWRGTRGEGTVPSLPEVSTQKFTVAVLLPPMPDLDLPCDGGSGFPRGGKLLRQQL